MLNKNLIIKNRLGLHARASSLLVKVASAYSSAVTVCYDQREGDGKSIMSMMLLKATFGSEIKICIDGKDEAEALLAIEELVNKKFGEIE